MRLRKNYSISAQNSLSHVLPRRFFRKAAVQSLFEIQWEALFYSSKNYVSTIRAKKLSRIQNLTTFVKILAEKSVVESTHNLEETMRKNHGDKRFFLWNICTCSYFFLSFFYVLIVIFFFFYVLIVIFFH